LVEDCLVLAAGALGTVEAVHESHMQSETTGLRFDTRIKHIAIIVIYVAYPFSLALRE
jgi:hypothetical protein